MRLILLITAGVVLSAPGCSDSSNNSADPIIKAPDEPSPSPTPTPHAPTETTAEATIGPAGGALSLKDMIEVDIPRGVLSEPTLVHLELMDTPDDEDLEANLDLLGVKRMEDTSFRLTFGSFAPAAGTSVKIYASDSNSNDPIGVLALFENEAEEEGPYPTWELVDSAYLQDDGVITFNAVESSFSSVDSSGRHYSDFILVESE